MKSIFEQIISGEVFVDKVFENTFLIVIKDRFPQAPTHLLIIPKKHYRSLQEVPQEELTILAEVGAAAQKLAKEFNLEEGYRLVVNNGQKAGQTVWHLHFHLIGGKELDSMV